MAYSRTFWKDHVTDQEGHVIQQGTLLDQQHFNNMEEGISDGAIAHSLMIAGYMNLRRTTEQYMDQNDAEVLGEIHTVTLTNNRKHPFNSTIAVPVSVALTKTRKNLYYSVEAQVDSFSGGLPGDLHISDKALNGFKISFDGSATSVTVTIRIKGGMT